MAKGNVKEKNESKEAPQQEKKIEDSTQKAKKSETPKGKKPEAQTKSENSDDYVALVKTLIPRLEVLADLVDLLCVFIYVCCCFCLVRVYDLQRHGTGHHNKASRRRGHRMGNYLFSSLECDLFSVNKHTI